MLYYIRIARVSFDNKEWTLVAEFHYVSEKVLLEVLQLYGKAGLEITVDKEDGIWQDPISKE